MILIGNEPRMDEEHEGRRREEIAPYLVNYKVKILLLLITSFQSLGKF